MGKTWLGNSLSGLLAPVLSLALAIGGLIWIRRDRGSGAVAGTCAGRERGSRSSVRAW
ncbi:hypothetical protein IDH44_15425 [Paenibacillus sp. IB182496]|uniref:Uncharacterized protein n=1 Tax=Paenibacillus sabuli TaxID=2772509 RepID=A0A927BVN3_9BACL|nr:hypothetical protein [Paenibacillus sabuli]MBD2846590.1 hypothetical protein [Paenibacillus sabuli]